MYTSGFRPTQSLSVRDMTQTVKLFVEKESQVGANSVRPKSVGLAVASEVFLPAVLWEVKEVKTKFG